MAKVMILMGSDSDWNVMKKAALPLKEFGISFEVRVTSAHRSPMKTIEIVKNFDGVCFIVGAGAAAHLAGVVASHTAKPVIAVPINSGSLGGVDALYATVQMPSGVPVACMAIDGAKNGALFAIQIIAAFDKKVADKFDSYKKNLVDEVNKKEQRIQEMLKEV